jgi:hypothetical protein
MSEKYNFDHDYWIQELNQSHNFLQNYLDTAAKIAEIYLPTKKNSRTKLKYNLFNSNVGVLKSALFARLPKPSVSRRFSDQSDQVGRVASNILERALTFEMSSTTRFRSAVDRALKDYLVVGSGWLYNRYDAEVTNPTFIQSSEVDDLAEGSVVIANQNTSIEYIDYKDVRWSPARSWDEVEWWARRVFIDEEDFVQRFGKDKATGISFKDIEEELFESDVSPCSDEGKAEVWEIWSKEDRKIYYVCTESSEVIDVVEDMYGLPEFFPTTPMFANVNNDQFIPVSDFQLLETQYKNLETLNNRIAKLATSVRVAGVYNSEHPEVKQLLENPGDNILVPMKGWDAFVQKGGVAGSLSFLPMTEQAGVIQQLSAQRAEMAAQIESISGISDIIRGGSSNPYESASASQLKAQYSTVRLGAKSQDLAYSLTMLIQNRAHLMCKFYTPEQLLSRIGQMPQADEQFIQPALQLLSDELTRMFMIEISTDALMAEDFARNTDEKTMVLQQLAGYIPQAIQGAQQIPELGPLFLELMRWVVAGTRGAREIEGILDQSMSAYAASQADKQANPPPEKPDPAMEQINAQLQMNQLTQQTAQQTAQQEFEVQMKRLDQEFQLKQMQLQNDAAQLEFQRLKFEREMQVKQVEIEIQASMNQEKLKQADEHFLMQLSATAAPTAIQHSTTQIVLPEPTLADPVVEDFPKISD